MKLLQGDCLDLMRQFPRDHFDLVLTDPPYGVNLKPQRKGGKFHGKSIANDADLSWLKPWCLDLYRVAKNACYIFVDYQHLGQFQQALKHAGFAIKNVLIWDKDWLGMGNNWRPNYEMIILATKGPFKTHSRNVTNVLKYRRIAPQRLRHVAEKPVALLEKLITESSRPGDLILDCFAGSGSTVEACINTQRDIVAMELNPEEFNNMVHYVKSLVTKVA